MLKKTCPYCNKNSYSATLNGIWICPHCQKDISDVPTNSHIINLEKKLVDLVQKHQDKSSQELEEALRKAFAEAGVPGDEVWIKLLVKFRDSAQQITEKSTVTYIMYEPCNKI